MPELLGQHEDILTDIKLLKLYSQEEETLSDAQKAHLNRLPKSKRSARKEEILRNQEREKKERLRIRTLELEDKVKKSDLPSDITGEILEMLAYAKERDMTFMYSVEKKIEALEVKIHEAEIQKAQEEEKQMKALQNAAMVGTAVVAGMALAPFVQVRYNKEEFEKQTVSVYEEKVLKELATAIQKPIVPLEPKRTYPKKQGDLYGKSHYKLAQKQEEELMDILVRDVQKSGKTKQTREEIIQSFEQMPEVKKRATRRAIRLKNPELAARQDAEKKLEEKATIDRGIVRLKRKHAIREEKLKRAMERRRQQLNQNLILRVQRVQNKEPRITARSTTQRPPLVKGISPAAKQAQMAPTAMKEEKKGISARLLKVEQRASEKGEMKGISAALAAAEQQKIQEAKERVVAESKGKFNPDERVIKPLNPEQKSRIETLVKGKKTTSPEFWRKAAERRQYKEVG
ncbi:MAG: hypothetical protein SPL08_02585 [Pseudomonadota bacterium]|nr:hypothetical protein [Pseudomonadota bacterium]